MRLTLRKELADYRALIAVIIFVFLELLTIAIMLSLIRIVS